MANTKPAQYHVIVREPSAKAADNEGENFNLFTVKKDRESIFDFISDFAVARDKAVKDAIEAGEVDAKDIESIKKVRAAVPTVPLPETLAAGSDDEEERTVYQKKRLLSLEVARASRVRGVGAGTSHSHEHEIAHRPELTSAGAATSSNSDTD